MKILKRASKGSVRFKVVKNSFQLASGYVPEIGQELDFVGPENLSLAFGLVQRGLIVPNDLPEVGEYIVMSSFYLPGKNERFEAKVNEFVELKASDAIKLMLQGKVIPKDPDRWSPFRRKDPTPFENQKSWKKK